MKGNRPSAIINQRLLTSPAPPVTGDLDKKKCQLDQTFLRVLSNVRSISNHEDANPTGEIEIFAATATCCTLQRTYLYEVRLGEVRVHNKKA